jgi:hypothetical protein
MYWKILGCGNVPAYFDKCGIKQVVALAPVKEKGAVNVVLGANRQKSSIKFF